MRLWNIYCIIALFSMSGCHTNEIPQICKENHYFDVINLQCSTCSINYSYVSREDPYSCICWPGYIKNGKKCVKCPEKHITLPNLTSCIKCSNGIENNITLQSCSKCPEKNMITKIVFLNNTNTTILKCFKCDKGTLADQSQNICVPCHESLIKASSGKCSCPLETHELIHGICALKSQLATIPEWRSVYKIEYKEEHYESDLFYEFYRITAYSCTFLKNATSCQFLVNLCVLLHYSYDSNINACSYYRAAFIEIPKKVPNYVPTIYFDKKKQNILTEPFLNKTLLMRDKPKFSLDENALKKQHIELKISVLKYSLDGVHKSVDYIKNIFSFCPELLHNHEEIHIGETVDLHCPVSTDFVLRNYEMEFFEFFIQYRENEQIQLKFIPMLNTNLKVANKYVNRIQREKWLFTKRMFLIDNISGRTEKGKAPEFLRYADTVELVFPIKSEHAEGHIYQPYIKVNYKEMNMKEFELLHHITINFKITYSVTFYDAIHLLDILFGVSGSMSLILALIKAWSFANRSGRLSIDLVVIIKFLCIISGYIANCFFFILFALCTLWFLVFKFQDVLWTYLPNEEEEKYIKYFIVWAFSLKIIHILYILYNQITIDLFFIDWEQPKTEVNYRNNQRRANENLPSNYVSIWRTYFIANEWNELQTHRKVNVPLLLFGMIFYLKVVNYEDTGRLTIIGETSSESVPFSFVSRFVLSIIFFISGSIAQALFRVGVYERYIENKIQMFVDLCSMANISVLILKNRLFGFYIHGRSVHGEADLDMRAIIGQLKKEEDDLCQGRGLETSTECQTFQVRITQKFRQNYDSILNNFETYGSSRDGKKDTQILEKCIEAHDQMKHFLSIFLQHGMKEMDFVIKDKLFLENILDVEFEQPLKSSHFYRDSYHAFDQVLFYGEESAYLAFEMMVFTFVDMHATNFILSSFITYLVYRLVNALRSYGSKKNMIKKTLVDGRFLV